MVSMYLSLRAQITEQLGYRWTEGRRDGSAQLRALGIGRQSIGWIPYIRPGPGRTRVQGPSLERRELWTQSM